MNKDVSNDDQSCFGTEHLTDDVSGTVTLLLGRVRDGVSDSVRSKAFDDLFAYIEVDLRRFAQSVLNAGRLPSGGVNGTELVNMACVRLLGQGRLNAQDRRHFFFVLGRAMSDVLVDEARRTNAKKRGGDWGRVALTEFVIDGESNHIDILDLRTAIDELRAADEIAAKVVEARYLSGRSIAETAELLSISIASTRRNWDYARAWLKIRLDQ